MMTSTSLSIRPDYWLGFQITQDDIEFIYNFLLEVETPQTPNELIRALVQNRILQEKAVISEQIKSGGSIYLPKDEHKVGQTLSFPTRNWQEGIVTSVRPGSNPELAPFNVIEVEFRGWSGS